MQFLVKTSERFNNLHVMQGWGVVLACELGSVDALSGWLLPGCVRTTILDVVISSQLMMQGLWFCLLTCVTSLLRPGLAFAYTCRVRVQLALRGYASRLEALLSTLVQCV